MLVDETKKITFDEKNYEQWQELASASLKGLPFERLITKTIEGIDLYPLYTKNAPKLPSLHSIREAKEEVGWTIAQMQYAANAKSFLRLLEESMQLGNEAVVYDGLVPIDWDSNSIEKLATYVTRYPIYFYNVQNTDSILSLFELLDERDREKVTGIVEVDKNDERLASYPNVRTLGVNLIEAHHLGADVVTELALTLAKAAEQADACQSFQTVSQQFFVRFAVDTHFFMEIAKLRAFRVLWEALSNAYEEEVIHIPLLTETSKRSFSTVDPYVNLLRAGNSAFSAILGGTDVLTVHPHDVLTNPTTTSIRLARNIQLVVKEETLVDEVLDPAGGSYFIEALTKELVEKAWALFVEIEESGGYTTYTNSEHYKKRLKELYDARILALAQSKDSLVGTNVYADLTAEDQLDASLFVKGRLSEPFEKFRKTFKNKQPNIALITFGALKDFKPRADFVSGFLATGGLKAVWSPEFERVDEALTWIQQKQFDYIIICATNDRTKEVVTPLLKGLQKELLVDLAGKYDEELRKEWSSQGLNGFIYQGLNKLEKFTDIYDRWKGE